MVHLPRALGVNVRIALVHSFYRSENPSGENAVVEAEVAALRRAGCDVELFAISTDDVVDEPLYSPRAALRVATGLGRNPLADISAFEPDVVHVHNLFPNFGRAWVRKLHAPLVATLHNYRPLCAKGILYREGSVCTLCPDGARWSGVRYACYRDSHLATLPLAWANRKGAGSDVTLERADAVITLTDHMRALYVNDGVDSTKVRVAPHFLPDQLDPGRAEDVPQGAPWLFVGRLDEPKGVMRLIEKWPHSEPLRIVGDGPLRDAVRAATEGRPEIELLGLMARDHVIQLMQESVGLVFPSRCYESFGLAYLEALSCGLPVLALRPNVVHGLVDAEGTGSAVTWEQFDAELLSHASAHFATVRERCRGVFQDRYSEGAFIARRLELYVALVPPR